ncbi:envelope glycoprotein [Human immunodeficiency virus 1]|uniref:Envelope glycoprotein gp160 n=1 Tax=Human immunodeficiency virus type 1 TaxID=11676 RepID=Q66Q70_HV1|nr:envelope glycoprotein [Human immunodeficiency virus 1]AAU08230.1 envelope glycoprotein [Human immunodeficiency virus 1]
MIVTMRVMEKRNRKLGTLYIVMALIIPCLSHDQLYATVFAGVPVWEDAAPVLFCASDVNLTSTEQHNIWASQACVPTDPTPYEYPLTNVTDNFNVWKNYMVEQMQEDIISLWEQSLKPCVQMTFLCVQMNCTNVNGTNANGTRKEQEQLMKQCEFNVTTVLKDKKEKKQALFYVSDLSKLEGNNTSDTMYTLINCNSTTIKQACPKVTFEPIPIHYCAPAGYAIFQCNSPEFNGTGECSNITVVTCTLGIRPTVSTQLVLNGTLSKEKIRIMGKNISDSAKNIIVTLNSTVNMTCERPWNQTVQEIRIGPMAWYSMGIIREEKSSNLSRLAYCKYNITDWEKALKQVAERYLELVNYTDGNASMTFKETSGGDPEITQLHFNCHGEFFYCNTSGMFNYTFSCKGTNCTTNQSSNETSIPCRIKQIVRSWMRGESGLYAPPIKGNLTCRSRITGMILQIDMPWNKSEANVTFRPVGGDMKDIWRTELFKYKVVEIKPFSVAPTKIARPVIGTDTHREKRAVGLGMLFLGVLSAAGSTMGATATALTVQTHTLIKGIVQQQDNLLRAIQAQQQLLRLSVWGIRQLRARLLALETLIQNQQLLNLWGCKGRLICYTSVKWNDTWTKTGTNLSTIWENLTWQQWDQQIDNISYVIYDEIQKAQVQQEQNEKKLLELDEWASLWNWLDITKWLWYIKIAIIIVGALIGVRIVIIIINLVRNIRQGYQPLSFQIPIHHQSEAEAPGGTGEGGGEGDRPKLTRLPQGFLLQLYTDLRTIILWSYHLLSNLASGIQTVISHLGLGLWILGQKIIDACRICTAVVQYWLQELQSSATNLLDTLAVAVANWTDSIFLGIQRIGRGILNIPRRIRQGLEQILL